MTLSEYPDQEIKFEKIKRILLLLIESITDEDIETFSKRLKPRQQEIFKKLGEQMKNDQLCVVALSKLSKTDLDCIKNYKGVDKYLVGLHDLKGNLHTLIMLQSD